MSENRVSTQTVIILIVAWVWVGIPLVWGIYQTYLKSVALFK